MTKAAFDKIKSGLDDVRRYLDGSADKREFRVSAPINAKVTPIPPQAQPPEEEK